MKVGLRAMLAIFTFHVSVPAARADAYAFVLKRMPVANIWASNDGLGHKVRLQGADIMGISSDGGSLRSKLAAARRLGDSAISEIAGLFRKVGGGEGNGRYRDPVTQPFTEMKKEFSAFLKKTRSADAIPRRGDSEPVAELKRALGRMADKIKALVNRLHSEAE